MSEIELKGCINCKYYKNNYRCERLSITNIEQLYEPCQYWEGRIDNVRGIFNLKEKTTKDDQVNHPKHYTDGRIEVIEYIEDKNLGFCLGNAIKYISRAGKKEKDKEIQDLRKAMWYIERRIYELENNV